MRPRYSIALDTKAVSTRPFLDRLRAWASLWEHPLWSGLLALLVYAVLTSLHSPLWHISGFPFYNYLADAFLHGRLDLRLIPPNTHDLSLYQGRYYLYWSPLPAIVLVPFVALFGVQFSDIVFTIAVGALDVALVALVLRYACARRVIRLSRLQRSLLVLFFAFGTVHIILAPYGRVWFTGQLVGFACVALAYLAAFSRGGRAAFVLTGLALAGALLTRNHLVLAGLWPACYLLYRYRAAGWRRLASYALAASLPILVAIWLQAAYNWARFGSLFENGIAYHQMALNFTSDFQRYGAFNLYYLPTNLFYQYIAYPFPLHDTSFIGGSLFLLSPLFFAAFWGLATARPRWSAWALAATIMLINIPILLLMGTGWLQFGPRYTLDFTVPLLLLTALGMRRWPTWALALLTALSIAQYVVGALYFGQFFASFS